MEVAQPSRRREASPTPSEPTLRQPNSLQMLTTDAGRPQVPSFGSFHSAKEVMDPVEDFDEELLTPPHGDDTSSDTEGWNTVDNIMALGLSFGLCDVPAQASPIKERFILEGPESKDEGFDVQPARPPFEKWMRTLHKKAKLRRRTVSDGMAIEALDSELYALQRKESTIHRLRKSASGSSLGFVTAVKSASISLASFSIATRSRNLGRSSKYQKTDRSSRTSNVGPRTSEDSSYIARSIVNDAAVTNRSIRRRRVLEEIISTEEGYVGDIRFLMNVYVTLLASIPTISLSLRASINRNLTEIVELHDEILGDLHRVVPNSEYTQSDYIRPGPVPEKQGHHRWRSLDAVPEHAGDLSWMQKIPGMTADAHVAAEVAKVFGKRMHRFFTYEEYGAKYEMMVKDVASTYRTLPQWEVYQKGLEALAASLSSANIQHDQPNKSLTVGDLLVKPIQRVCRYPLLFAEMLRQTPVCDCPESHMEIEKVLVRLRETTSEINKATDDPSMRATMEKTWLIQDRLIGPDQVDLQSKTLIRTLGHLHLCGVLHIAWQTKDSVDGQYMIALLYRDCLVLATAGRTENSYGVRATIFFNDIRIEEADNGKGLQCHTAPYSWKIVFECDHQLFEIILSACSPKEELEWKSRLTDSAGREHIDGCDQAFFTSVLLGIKSLGTVFGKPGTVARRLSIHRATTVGPKSPLCQVIIKNTSALKDAATSSTSAAINRSQSLLATNRIPVLAPSRGDRIRLERLLSDVWTRQILPYPGMTGRSSSEHRVRSSASTMMRKLSVASITGNFTKRSGNFASLTSLNRPSEEDHDDARIYNPVNSADSSVRDKDSGETSEDSQKLASIQDLDFQFDSLFDEKMVSLTKSPTVESTIGTMKRLATLRVKDVLQPDGNRNITPPLRTPSANSLNPQKMARTASGGSLTQICASPASDASRESENQFPTKPARWVKGSGLHHLVSTESISRFFG